MIGPLLQPDEPSPVIFHQGDPASPFLITCDHAGQSIPKRLGTLGVPDGELDRHIAWDIGAEKVTAALGAQLGATTIRQRYSRLVIDCNRLPGHEQSIATISERTAIPGNANLTADEREQRRLAIFQPYHEAIAAELDRRSAGAIPTVMIALHSFTPVYLEDRRIWEAGVLYNRLPAFSQILRGLLIGKAGLVVGDNEPYQLSDASDYTIPFHAERRGLPYVELEIRQDLISDDQGQERWIGLLASLLPEAYATFLRDPHPLT